MKRIFYLLFFFLFVGLAATQGQDVFDPNDPDMVFTRTNHPDLPPSNQVSKWGHSINVGWNTYNAGFRSYYFRGMVFRLKYPKTLQKNVNDGKKYPVYVFLHGAGEVGNEYDNEKQLVHGAQLHASKVNSGEYDAFLLYPQSKSQYSSNLVGNVVMLLDSLAKYVKADVDRVVVGGLSSGGTSMMHFLVDAPKSWAATTPISTGDLSLSNIPGVLSIPMWIANGGKDTKPLPQAVTNIVNRYNDLGGDIRQSFFPNGGHGIWDNFWAVPGYFDYLNAAHKAQPVVKYQHTEWCPTENIHTVLILTPDFYQYEWQKDNVTISGATLDSLVVTEFGTYRARFKRTANSNWSDWSPRPVEVTSKGVTNTPPIAVQGLHSMVLPAPDGATTVPLMLPDTYETYEWVRTSDNVLVGDSSIYLAPVGTYKARVTEKFGCSSLYSDPFTVVAANGADHPDAASNATAIARGSNEINVFWDQTPNPQFNETNFEVYRATTAGGPYSLVGIVPADESEFNDLSAEANTTYYYIIRAVNNNGASPVSNEANATTASDDQAPTAPANLSVNGVTRHSVSLTWTASTDDVGIKNYEIYVNGTKSYVTTETEYEVFGLEPFTNYTFYIRAVDLSGNKSVPSGQVTAFTKQNGINYSIYQGSWDVLPNFNTLTPVQQGFFPNISLQVSPYSEYYGMVWEGTIDIPSSGNYTFYLSSDDGSALYFDQDYSFGATKFINNDGLHGTTEVSKTAHFDKGEHKIVVVFFQKTGGAVLNLMWKRPGFNSPKEVVPDSQFGDNETPSGNVPNVPTGLGATAPAFNKVQLSWQDNSADETGFEIFRKSAGEENYVIIARTESNITSYTDSTTSGSTQYTYTIQAVNGIGESGFSGEASVTTPVAPAIPDVPGDLSLTAISGKVVELSFTDFSSQTGYEVERSVGSSNQFRFFRSLETTATQVTLRDSGLFANTEVYYRVRAIGISGNSDFSTPVSVVTLNSQPKLGELGTKQIYYNSSSSIVLSATDEDEDELNFTFSNLPSFASFQATGNGTGQLQFNPAGGHLGEYNIGVTVADNHGGSDNGTLTLVVSTNQAPVFGRIRDIYVKENADNVTTVPASDPDRGTILRYELIDAPDFVSYRVVSNKFMLVSLPGYGMAGVYTFKIKVSDGNGGEDVKPVTLIVEKKDPSTRIYMNVQDGTQSADFPWNNIKSLITANLKDENDNPTDVSISIGSPKMQTSSDGVITGDNSGVYPDAVIAGNFYFGVSGVPNVVTVTLSGLQPNSKYRLTAFASSTYGNGPTIYTIGDQTRELNVSGNTSRTAFFNLLESDAQGKIEITMSKGVGVNNGYLNALVLEKPYVDGRVPFGPQDLKAEVQEGRTVRLNWKNTAYNALGYKLLRSESENGTYTVVSGDKIAFSDTTYVDDDITGNKTYYYKLFGYNDAGNSDTSGIASAQIANRVPELLTIGDIYIKAGTTKTVNIAANDDADDNLTFEVTGLPGFASFQTTGNGTGIITLNPAPDVLGIFKNVSVIVRDNTGAEDSESLNIHVTDGSLKTVLINLNGEAPAPWNNYNAAPNTTTRLLNMLDDLNQPTAFSFRFSALALSKSDRGMMDGNDGLYPDEVMGHGLSVNNNNATILQFSGLDPAKKYNVAIFSSTNTARGATGQMTAGGKTVAIDARYNTNRNFQLNDLSPNGSGILEVNVTRSVSDKTLLINAARLEEYNDGDFLKPGDLMAEPTVSKNSIQLKWTDKSESETGYEIYRSVLPSSGYTLISTTVANTNEYLDNNGLTPGKTYYYKVRGKKSGSFSDYSNIAQFSLASDLVLVNMNVPDMAAPAPWNNLNDLSGATGSGILNLVNDDMINTGVNFEVTSGFAAAGFEGSSNPGILPVIVMRSDYFTDAGKVTVVKFSGLNLEKAYRVGVFNSVVQSSPSFNYSGVYTVNGVSKVIDGYNNNFKMLYFNNVLPDEQGEITISITPDERFDVPYTFTNAFTLEGYAKPTEGLPGAMFTSGAEPETSRVIAPSQPQALSVAASGEEKDVIRIKAFPNPFTTVVAVEVEFPSSVNTAHLELYDAQLRPLFKKEVANAGGGNGRKVVTLPVQNGWAPGIYLLRLTAGNEAKTVKLIKSK